MTFNVKFCLLLASSYCIYARSRSRIVGLHSYVGHLYTATFKFSYQQTYSCNFEAAAQASMYCMNSDVVQLHGLHTQCLASKVTVVCYNYDSGGLIKAFFHEYRLAVLLRHFSDFLWNSPVILAWIVIKVLSSRERLDKLVLSASITRRWATQVVFTCLSIITYRGTIKIRFCTTKLKDRF